MIESASQKAPNIYSKINKLSDPPNPLTYINPYLKYPPRHNHYSTSPPQESSSASTFQYFSNEKNPKSLHFIHSPASTYSVNSDMSSYRSTIGSPSNSAMSIDSPNSFPLHKKQDKSCMFGTDFMNLHHKHSKPNDSYEIMSKPKVMNYRNNKKPSDITCRPMEYIVDSNLCKNDTGSHV
jgi:hypothetical protein